MGSVGGVAQRRLAGLHWSSGSARARAGPRGIWVLPLLRPVGMKWGLLSVGVQHTIDEVSE